MLGIVAVILFAISWFEHGAGASNVPAWFNSEGTLILGFVFLALHLVWPIPLRRP